MRKILKYSFSDLIRSYWTIIYTIFYFVVTTALIFFSGDLTKTVISMMNIVILLIPLISAIFGAIYYYNSKEFTLLLLSQPIKRTSIFLGQYLGVSLSLILSFLIGVGVPFLINGILFSENVLSFVFLIIVGVFLSFIFSAIGYWIALKYPNKIMGFGITLFIWLFLAILYDGIIMLTLILLDDYPTDMLAIVMSVLNPIDLSRIMVMLKLDISALMGYTGAVFLNFFGSSQGIIVAFSTLLIWLLVPVRLMIYYSNKKDF